MSQIIFTNGCRWGNGLVSSIGRAIPPFIPTTCLAKCGASAPRYWEVVLPELGTDGAPCDVFTGVHNCDNWGGTFYLEHNTPPSSGSDLLIERECKWYTPLFTATASTGNGGVPCVDSNQCVGILYLDSPNVFLTFRSVQASRFRFRYRMPLADFDCLGPNTLPLESITEPEALKITCKHSDIALSATIEPSFGPPP